MNTSTKLFVAALAAVALALPLASHGGNGQEVIGIMAA
jgi:hypothetical protein